MRTKFLIWILALVLLAAAVSALEVKSGTSESLTIFLKNATSNAPATGATCTISVWNTTNVKIADNSAMTEMGDGFYYYNTLTTTPWRPIGNFRVLAKCIYGGKSYYSAMMYSVVQNTVTNWFTAINKTTVSTNTTVNSIYSYLQNTVYPAVDTLEASMVQLKANNTNIWTKLGRIGTNLTTTYNAVNSVNTAVIKSNATIMAELNNAKNRLAMMNTTLNTILANITQAVVPKLNTILTDTATIKGYTDTLESGVTSILSDTAQIKSTLTTISTKTDTVIGYVDEVEKGLKCTGGVNVSAICSRVAAMNSTINTINTNTDSLEAGQTNIIAYVDTLESGQATLTSKINEVKSYLNCSTALTNSVCWRLNLIQSYTDSLEAGQTTIQGYVDTLESGQTTMLSDLSTIKGYTDTLEAGIIQLRTDIANVNTTNKARFSAIDANLSRIYSDTQYIRTNLAASGGLTAAQNATLYAILGKVTAANLTINNVKSYLEGTITSLLTEINQTTSFTLVSFGGTEYASGEMVKLSIQLLQGASQNPVTGASCTYNIYYPNNALYRTGTMPYLTNGIYYTNFTAPLTEGVYVASYNCTVLGQTRRSSDTFHIASWANKIGVINSSINSLQASVNQLKANNTNIWNRLAGISQNLTTTYAAVNTVNTNVIKSNQTIMNDLVSQRLRLNEINTTVTRIYNNITQTVVPKLNTILSDTALIKGYTDTLESTQTTILSDLSTIKGYTDSVESGITQIRTDIANINATSKARFNAVDANLSRIYSDTQYIRANLAVSGGLTAAQNATLYAILGKVTEVNTTINNVEDYLNGKITTFLTGINKTTTNINATVNSIYSYLQNTIYPAVDTLESSATQLKANNTNIWNRLAGISQNLTTTYNAVNTVNTNVIKSNQTIMNELSVQRSRLNEINTTVTRIYNNITQTVVPKLNTLLTDTALIKGYTDTLEAGQTSILSDLTTIKGYTDTLESGITQIRSDIQKINATSKARFDAIDLDLANIYADTQSILTSGVKLDSITNQTLRMILSLAQESNTTIHDVEDYMQGTVTTYLQDINETAIANYNLLLALNSTVASIYANTQTILVKWDDHNMSQIWTKLEQIQTDVNGLNLTGANLTIDNTAVLSALNRLEGITNSTRTELGFKGKSLTAYDYFVQLENELLLINETVLNKIEFESTLTRSQINNAIAGNASSILTEVNSNSADLTTLLGKWGTVNAQQLLNNITDNRNKLISLQNWLNAFNDTEYDRYNSTYTYMGGLFNWFTLLNQTEMQRHNITQEKINDVYSLLNLTYVNSVSIIADIGYSGSGTTLYDDVLKVLEGNENITILCRQLNLTSIQINRTLTNVSYVVNNIYSYLQNTIYPAVDTLESSMTQLKANNTRIWNKLAGISQNLTTTYNAVNTVNTNVLKSNQTIMNELNNEKNRLAMMNVTLNKILANITQAVVPKLDLVLTDTVLIKGYTDSLELGHTNILSNLTRIQQYTDTLESGVTQIRSDIQKINATNKARFDAVDSRLTSIYADTQSIINSGVKLDGITNQTLNRILHLTQEANFTINNVEAYLQGTITQLLLNINYTVTANNNLLQAMNITLGQVHSDTTAILAKWGSYNASQIMTKLNAIETKIDNLNVSGGSGNNSEVLAAIRRLETITNATRAELNFTGKGITAFEYFVRLENAIYDVNKSLFTKIEFEANSTRLSVLQAIKANNTLLYNQLLNNSNKLDSILTKWGSVDAEQILDNITDTRNRVIDIKTWLLAFNNTEYDRYNSTYTYVGGLFNWFTLLNQTEQQRHDAQQQLINNAFAVINNTNELIVNLTAQIGYEGQATTLYDDIQTLITQTANITVNIGALNITVEPSDYVLLHTGKNLFAMPKEPTNPAIATVLAELNTSYYRVDYYNQTSETFQTYIPSAPFGNTLNELHKSRVYWIWMYYDDILFVK